MTRICLSFLTAVVIAANVGGVAGLRAQDSSTIDLARYFFADSAAVDAAQAKLSNLIDTMMAFNGGLSTGPALLGALKTNDEIQKLSYTLWAYYRVRCTRDRQDSACGALNALNTKVATGTSFLMPAVQAIDAQALAAMTRQTPQLAGYEFAISGMRVNLGHALPPAARPIVDRLTNPLLGWEFSAYQDVLARIAKSAGDSPSGREAAYRRRLTGLNTERDALALILVRVAEGGNAIAQAYGYGNAPDRKYMGLDLSPAQTRGLLTRMSAAGELVRRYQTIRASEIRQGTQQAAGPWDMSAPTPGVAQPHYDLGDARAVLHEAFATLGDEYQRAFDGLLDPRAGRSDILLGGAPQRYAGGYSVGFTGTPAALFIGRYDGSFKSVSVIAHEGGHAVHRALMNANNVMPSYATGPNYLFESFAAFNELVLADSLARRASDAAHRRYFEQQWMNIKGLDAFYGAQDALFEQALHDGVATTIKTADDLDRVSGNVDRPFSIFVDKIPEFRTRWATISLAYEDPLYSINYVYGGLLALKYFDALEKDPKRFVPRYIALLKNGFDDTAPALLKRFLGIDVTDPSLLDDDCALLRRRLEELERDAPSR